MRQSIIDKLRTARPEDMGRDVLEFFGLKPGERLDWNADNLNIGDESVSMAEVISAIKEADVQNGVRDVAIVDLRG